MREFSRWQETVRIRGLRMRAGPLIYALTIPRQDWEAGQTGMRWVAFGAGGMTLLDGNLQRTINVLLAFLAVWALSTALRSLAFNRLERRAQREAAEEA